MSTLTNLPASLVPGTPSSPITLSMTSLISEMNITDPYFSIDTNWSKVVFNYVDATGSESTLLRFYMPSVPGIITAVLSVSSHARQNAWRCTSIAIFDFDNGVYVIPRSSFPTPAEFDFTVYQPPLVYPGSNILTSNLIFHLAMDKASAGIGPFSPGATTAGQAVYDSGPSHRSMAVENLAGYAVAGSAWGGTGANGDPYVFNKTARNQLGIQLAADFNAARPLTIGVWYKSNSTADVQRLLGSDLNNYGYVLGLQTTTCTVGQYSANSVIPISVNPIDENWHYVVFTSDSTNGIKVYIDSVHVGTYGSSLVDLYFDYIGGQGRNDAYGDTQLSEYGAIGQFGDVHIYNVSLSPADVTTNFNQTKVSYGF